MGSKRRVRGTSAPRPPASRAGSRPGARPRRADRVLIGSVLGTLLFLALVGDDRHAGLVADGRQMIRTAIAIAETGEIGQARGRDFTIDRVGGDAVSRFGMATSLLQVPAAWMAPRVEARRGPGSSQALFLLVPWLTLGIAAAAAGALARRLGGGHVEVTAAVLLASVASPLGSYALMEFSEPVQAAALAVALWAALAAAQEPAGRRGLELVAGFAAGLAVLTKSSLIVTVPLVLFPLVDLAAPQRTLRALLRAGAGASAPLAVWAAFEILRFGRFFGGYPDDGFTHPWLDGAWRLLVGPNRGFLLFWPALVLFLWAGGRWQGAWLATPAARAWLGAALVFASQVAVVAGYWGWHGMEGWGPRLILAPVAVLAPFAAVAAGPRRRPLLAAVVVLCVVVNLPPLVQHPTPVSTYVTNVAWPEIDEQEASRYPFYATSRSTSGQLTVVPFAMLDLEPAASPWRVYPWFWRATRLDDEALGARLQDPPWSAARPDMTPAVPWPPEVARQVAPPPRLGFLGRSLTRTGGPYATVYLDALLDQVIRANQQGRIERALELSARRLHLQADGEAAAWRLETLRRAGRPLEAEALLRSLPERARRHPLVNVALALFDRDGGEERRARALMASVAASFPDTPVQQALEAPLANWPPTLDALTRAPRRDAMVGGSRQ
jgi:hypothetical protein